MKYICLVVISCLYLGCSKDKNMDDYRREELQEKISRINSVSGNYLGTMVSKLDGSYIGSVSLTFQARTDIQSSNNSVTSEQNVLVSGALSFKSLTSMEVVFNNGFYDEMTGSFQVTIPIQQNGTSDSKLYLTGNVSGNKWIGTIEAAGHPDFGGALNLTKNAKPSNTTNVQAQALRLQQLDKEKYSYVGNYVVNGENKPIKLSFINRDIMPELYFFKLFSPVRQVSINCDFTDFELNFSNAVLDDKAGTILAHDPIDQRGVAARANLSCQDFHDNESGQFGWDCQIQTKTGILNLHLLAEIPLSTKSKE